MMRCKKYCFSIRDLPLLCFKPAHTVEQSFGFFSVAGEGFAPQPLAAAAPQKNERIFMFNTDTEMSARIGFRLPSAVARDWRELSVKSGLSLSDWIRSQIDSDFVTGLPTPVKRRRFSNHCDPELIQHLARIGNNLNQIAHALNACKKSGSTVQLIEVLAVLRSQEEALISLLPNLPQSKSDSNAN